MADCEEASNLAPSDPSRTDSETQNHAALRGENSADNQKDEIAQLAVNSEDKTKTALDYEQIVNKLHKLANDDHPSTDKSTNDASISLDDNKAPKVNGFAVLKTPTNTPESSIIPSASSDSTVIISRDGFGISYIRYQCEVKMPDIMSLISKDLSEPYSIYTYRYFIHNWPNLCFLASDEEENTVGAIVCKIDPHKRTMRSRGYIAMLAVDHEHRRKKIGSNLVRIAIEAIIQSGADEIVLETEVTNVSALNLYEKLGFVRDKRLYKYYLNGVDAFRLKLWLT